MPLGLRIFCWFATPLAGLVAAGCALAGSPKQIPVEVWRGGDDGLTVRLTDAVEDAFAKSGEFVLSNGKKPGTLIVTVPTHVEWKSVDGRTQVQYAVNFSSSDGGTLGATAGSCWDDKLSECAAQILDRAKNAGARMR